MQEEALNTKAQVRALIPHQKIAAIQITSNTPVCLASLCVCVSGGEGGKDGETEGRGSENEENMRRAIVEE